MPAGAPISVLVADDHPVFLDGLVDALARRPELDVVARADSGEQALRSIRARRPQVAVLDLRMPSPSGMDVLRAIAHEALPTWVLMLSGEDVGSAIYEAMRLGARGYLTKQADRQEIGDAIVAIAGGGTVLGPHVQTLLAHELREHAPDDGPLLTPREHEVLRLIAEGRSGPAIAARLQIGTATVKTHTSNVYDKLGVSDRAAAVAVAMRRGLLS